MKRMAALFAVMFSAIASPVFAGDALSWENFSLRPNISTLGMGIEGDYRWNPYWGARAGVNGFAANFVYHDKDTDLHNKLTLLNAGVTADYYPFQGDFRLSAGLQLSANKIDGELRNLKKHGKHYTITIADPLTNYTVRQNAIQPYIGTGYSVELKERVSLNFDIGALYAGSPDLSVNSHAEKFGFTRRQINREIERQRDRLAPFQVLPVVQVGLRFKF